MLQAGLFVFMLVLADQAVKYAIVSTMALGQHIDIVPFISLYHVQNSGIAFSMLASFSDWGLIVLTGVVIIFVIRMWWKVRREHFLSQCGYLLIMGGALGNLTDRLRLHHVTDYILLYYGEWSFAIFNLADMFITIGALLIMAREVSAGSRRQ